MTFCVRLSVILLATLVILNVDGFYVPGVAPTDFKKGGEIGVKAIKYGST
jgi:hypothetical protein